MKFKNNEELDIKAEQKTSITLLDGSMGSYIRLNSGGYDPNSLFTKIWSAAALAGPEYHEKVINAHVEYIKAGSQILSTNSYGVQPHYYKRAFGKDDYENLMVKHAKLSADLAKIARERCPTEQNVKIFGALGPICESHNPKLLKKYIKEYGASFCIDSYTKISNALYEGGIDGFIIETMNSWEEAFYALEGIRRAQQMSNNSSPLPIMVNFQGSLRSDELQKGSNDEHKLDPETIGKLVIRNFLDYVDRNPTLNIISFGLNCASPENMMNSFRCIFKTNIYSKDNTDAPSYESVKDALNRRNIGVCAYPNFYDITRYQTQGYDVTKSVPLQKRLDLISNDYEGFLAYVDELIGNFNVRYIGGCCGCTSSGIKKLNEKYSQQNIM